MAKIDLKFLDLYFDDSYIKVSAEKIYLNQGVNIFISGMCGNDRFTINLDKSTAIKFAKTLRTEINKIETEVSNE